MSTPSRILCAVDFSRPAQAAFEQALALSAERHAELTAVHAVAPNERFNWQARERLAATDALRRAADARGVRLRVTEQRGDRSGVILLHANTGRFDLVVLGTHAGGTARRRGGSIAEQVIARAQCPVLVVPAADRPVLQSFRNLVSPTDFTPASGPALHHALGLLKDGGRLTLIHVTRAEAPATGFAYHFSVPEYGRLLQQDAWERMQDCVPVDVREKVDVRTRVVSGVPATEVVRIASEVDADLIVMGVRSRGALGRTLIGSTAARVVRTAGRPVLAVPDRMVARVDPTATSVARLAA